MLNHVISTTDYTKLLLLVSNDVAKGKITKKDKLHTWWKSYNESGHLLMVVITENNDSGVNCTNSSMQMKSI